MDDLPQADPQFVEQVVTLACSVSLRRLQDPERDYRFADRAWHGYLETFNRAAATIGAPYIVSPGSFHITPGGNTYLPSQEAQAMRDDFLRDMVDALAPLAAAWLSFIRDQKHRGGLVRTNPKLARLFDVVFSSRYDAVSTRRCFEDLYHLGDQYGLTMTWSDEPDVLEWDDIERGRCGDITLQAFTQRRSRARRQRKITQPRHAMALG